MRRRGAYSAAMLTLAVFLAPALLSPGPIEIANIAGVALAIWFAADTWRLYGDDGRPETFPYRAAPAAPGLIGSAALVFAVAIGHAWNAQIGAMSPSLVEIGEWLRRMWDFPFSPIRTFVDPGVYSPRMSPDAVRGVTLCLSMAIAAGLLFGLLTLFGRIDRPETLRAHARIWARKKTDADSERLIGRVCVRALSLLVPIVALTFAPAFFRVLIGFSTTEAQAFINSPLMNNLFFSVWLVGLWGVLVAASIIMFFAYLRLVFALMRR